MSFYNSFIIICIPKLELWNELNSSVPTGKSGGFRVIYFYKYEENIYLLDMYSKSDLDNIDENRLIEILVANGLE